MFWFQQIKLRTTLLLFDGTLKQELSGTNAYEQTSAEEKSVINNRIFQNATRFGVSVDEDQEKLPTFYWLPKLHKQPYKSRFIANSSSCTTFHLAICGLKNSMNYWIHLLNLKGNAVKSYKDSMLFFKGFASKLNIFMHIKGFDHVWLNKCTFSITDKYTLYLTS